MTKRALLAGMLLVLALAVSIRFVGRNGAASGADDGRMESPEDLVGAAPPRGDASPLEPEGEASTSEPLADPASWRPVGHSQDVPQQWVERFLTVEAPERVFEGKRMPVVVSLTLEETSPGTLVVSGECTTEGKLVLAVGTVQVVLSAPGFDIQEAIQPLVVPTLGDSEPVLFELVAHAIDGPMRETRLNVSLWRNGARIASAIRHVTVLGDTAERAPDATAQQAALSADAPRRTSARTHELQRLPDLTVEVWSDEGRQDRANVTVASPHRQTPRHEVWEFAELQPWMDARVARAVGNTRGLAASEAEGLAAAATGADALATWRGLGRELYSRLAPPVFQQMFWDLMDERGAQFRTIQIYTDLPWIPWELMRPSRPDGSGERDFLGIEMQVGRWHLSERTALLAPPPQSPRVDELVVIAPRYDGARRLSAQDEELAGLRVQAPVREVPGQLAELRKLLADLPQVLVHFAGHGHVDESPAGVPTYSILLEDGRLDLTTWLGLSSPQPSSHPFFFFNSCNVGRSERIAHFVEGWGPAVLERGACGYIGSLWPLDDAGASAFAIEFYARLYGEGALRGRVSAALGDTRRSFLEHEDPVGLAYVFYGDPNLTLDL